MCFLDRGQFGSQQKRTVTHRIRPHQQAQYSKHNYSAASGDRSGGDNVSKHSSKRALSAASIGNFGEIYDFAVFGFSVPFIAAHFFPGTDPVAAILRTFAVYAVAFVARPMGGLVFGYMLDKIGRIKVLAITIWLMAAGTAMIGLIPTYDTIGIAAPILLVVGRLAQGFAMGGETTGSTSFILEAAPDRGRGRWVGVIWFFAHIPNAFVALMLLGMQLSFGMDTYLDWAWRVPFLLGGLIGIIGWWLRRNLDDPEEYTRATGKAQFKNPLRAMTRSGWKSMMYLAMIQPLQTVGSYLLLGFMYTFLVKQAGLASIAALVSNAAAIVVLAAAIPIGGAMSDRWGRKTILSLGALWIALVVYPSISLASNGTLVEAVIGQTLIAIGVGLYGGACFVAAAEFFPTHFRATGHALSYQTTVAVLGGTTPLVSAWLVSALDSPLAPGWYVTFVAIICLILVRFVPETKGVDLSTSVDPHSAEQAGHSAITRRTAASIETIK
ncbi:MHS family proline/betaine transporter-like MFS transporter [Rhizobium sp. SLBN-94]|nr:MHS family proline/betaine transporter-like MFS transporter [Rhizobium sp. SLBN-94]